ncbi:tripartite tricarboxylate transporter TctB family protein [Aliihoeflea sp. 40Bstr573]|uniref:tripartite tricarboxylate transporter TctB family protein n=1 Tax=Aliihoeflea sp. 40Bstr573 TaxID=2696467 RepID=UPI002094BFB0|nr:tripartite tricarboxylate transporter TctB family protein [Aliihoeflea sp. 40Bstr573]MCO6386975.1 tripartite tricarboxylate transporter TctB family protein [Aliihoeflea sp. 40Bstr573]
MNEPDQTGGAADVRVPEGAPPGSLIFNGFLALASLVLAYQAWTISGFQSLSSAGVFPMLATGAMVVSMIVIIAGSNRRDSSGTGRRFFGDVISLRIVAFATLIIGYMLALQPLGFIVASYLFLTAAMFLLHRKRFLLTLVISAVSVAVIYGLFRYVFVVVLPRGVFF